MIKELCINEGFACIHSVTPKGGCGKSKFNHENIDIYERLKFNIKERKGIATSLFKNITAYQSKFGPLGLMIYDGEINNINRSDAGSSFNDENNLWESINGIQNPDIKSSKDEIFKANGSYIEINIFDYKICGFFIDLTELDWFKECARSLSEFYENTYSFELPYYGLSSAKSGANRTPIPF